MFDVASNGRANLFIAGRMRANADCRRWARKKLIDRAIGAHLIERPCADSPR